MKARELIHENETAIVIFTRGDHFHINDLGRGTTGNWVVDPDRELDKVIIYHRRHGSHIADVFTANHAGVEPSEEARRYIISLVNIRNVGSTPLNWKEFCDGGQNPIRYL